MADANDLLTLVEGYRAVNDEKGADGLATHDLRMARWITGVSRRIDDLCGPVVVRTVTDEKHDGGTVVARPKLTPVDTLTSVVEWDGTTSTTLTEETLGTQTSDQFMFYGDGHNAKIVRRSHGADVRFASGHRNVVVTYDAGRDADTANVDPMFKLAAENILRRLHHREAGAWARAADPFDPEIRAFFMTMSKTVVNEFLEHEMLPAY